jgi:hypothetical protein
MVSSCIARYPARPILPPRRSACRCARRLMESCRMPAASAARRLTFPRCSWLVLPLLGGLLLLAGCGPQTNTFAPYCPAPKRLGDAAQITIYRPGAAGQDITDLVLQGTIIDVSGTCKDGDGKKSVQADASVTFRFVRGPAMQGRSVDVPYLVTITLGDEIREQEALRMNVNFPSNIDTVTLASEPIHMVFPVTKTTNAASYTIWAAFRLTPEQLEYNRQRGQ